MTKGADSDDDTGGLVAEGEGGVDAEGAVAEFLEVGDVGAADAGGADGDLEFVGGGGWEGACFL